MNRQRLLHIAQRIDAALRAELGEGISPARLVDDALYARDVLLVCGAQPGSDLDSLGRHFRAALKAPAEPVAADDFNSSLPAVLDSDLPALPPMVADPGNRRWWPGAAG